MAAPTITATPGDPAANSYMSLTEADSYFADGLDNERWDAFNDERRARALIAATEQIDDLPLRGVRDDTSTPQALHFPRDDHDDVQVGEEEFTSDHDSAVQLDHVEISDDSETVTAADGTEYTEGAAADYTMDYEDGTITVHSTGDMEDATTYYISYDYYGIPEDIQQATCEQALWLLEQRANPELMDRPGLQRQGVRSLSMDGVSESYVPAGPAAAWAPKAWATLQGHAEFAGKIGCR